MSAGAVTASKERPLASSWRGWPLERILFALAGSVVGIATLLSAFVSPYFLLLTGFVSLNLLLFATLGNCGASIMLRLLGVRSGCDR
jgi:hypothetical protein